MRSPSPSSVRRIYVRSLRVFIMEPDRHALFKATEATHSATITVAEAIHQRAGVLFVPLQVGQSAACGEPLLELTLSSPPVELQGTMNTQGALSSPTVRTSFTDVIGELAAMKQEMAAMRQELAQLRPMKHERYTYIAQCALVHALAIHLVEQNAKENAKVSIMVHGEDVVARIASLIAPSEISSTAAKSKSAEFSRRQQLSKATGDLRRALVGAFQKGASLFPSWVPKACAAFSRQHFTVKFEGDSAWWTAWSALDNSVSTRHDAVHPKAMSTHEQDLTVQVLKECELHLHTEQLRVVLAGVYDMGEWQAQHEKIQTEAAARQGAARREKRELQKQKQDDVRIKRRRRQKTNQMTLRLLRRVLSRSCSGTSSSDETS